MSVGTFRTREPVRDRLISSFRTQVSIIGHLGPRSKNQFVHRVASRKERVIV
jgi:hypothetical protein